MCDKIGAESEGEREIATDKNHSEGYRYMAKEMKDKEKETRAVQ